MDAVLLPLILLALAADVRGCVCDLARPETMELRACSLTRVAASDRGPDAVFFIADANPTKPNRMLAIPHALHRTLNEMSAAERTAYWTAAIRKARSIWGEAWGIAVNGEERRTQCQLHAHIGKLLDTADQSGGVVVAGPAEIPLPAEGAGIWIHPAGDRLRVHVGDVAGELNLMR